MSYEETEVSINGYANNAAGGVGKRQPLVHILGFHYGDLQSIGFHPDDAEKIAEAILLAARAAKRGRDRKATIKTRDC